ncbi:MAG: single-stranded-DNA-specific exonuclease RecJ [Halanaerobiales bacterium]
MNSLWYIEDYELNNVYEDDVINKLLLNRGLDTKDKVDKFMNSNYLDLKDPYELTDMKKAVKRLITAINNNEKILIYGDYDVDGITSTSLLIHFFKDINFTNFEYYIPNRLKEGYGLDKESLENIEINKVNLLITVDCGITAVEEIDYLKQTGLDVIVTDHHKLGEKLPNADAVLDPQREKNDYYKVLAGVGVLYKFLQAVDQKLELNRIQEHLDLVALGTVADLVPLIDDNRILVKHGLERIKNTNKLGLKKLISKLKLDMDLINPGKIGYIIAPPINAIGRMVHPDQGVELLVTSDQDVAIKISQKLIDINKERQTKEEEIYKDTLNMIPPEDIKEQHPIILASQKWHRGVIGIVASRLVDKYHLPVILVALDQNGMGHGSARSISGLDITEGLEFSHDYLEKYGGHSMAAGLTIKKENISNFKQTFRTFLNQQLSPKDFIPGLKLDSIIDIDQINYTFYKKLEKLKPFGLGNPRPKFLLSNIVLKNHYTVGSDDKHLKIELQNGTSGICFNMGELNSKIDNKKLDLAAKLYLNNWRDSNQVELRVEDINIRSDHSYFPLTFSKSEYIIYDKRGINDKGKYIKGLKNYQENIAVYINGGQNITKLKEYLESENIKVLINDMRKFANEKEAVLLFDKQINRPIQKKIQLVMYSVPFSLSDLYSFINMFGVRNQEIHLIFNKNDIILNEKLISKTLPDENMVKNFYTHLKKAYDKRMFYKEDLYEKFLDQTYINKNKLNKLIKILGELDLLIEKGKKFIIKDKDFAELDLLNSVYYNNIIKVMEDYQNLKKVIKGKNLFKLINNLINLEEENNEF